MKVKIKAHELREADVSHISLVQRGANQIPFRITKSADKESGSMINLKNVFKGDKKEEPTSPQIVGYVILKEDNTEEVQKVLKEAGVVIEFAEECEDGCVVFKQSKDVSLEEVTAVKLSPELVVLTKGFSPYAADSQGGPLREAIAAQGFFPGVSMAMDALHTTLRTSLQKAESQKDAESAVTGLLDEFKSYVVELSKSMPATAFKASDAVSAYKVDKAGSCDGDKDHMSEEDKKKMKDNMKKEEASGNSEEDKKVDDKQEDKSGEAIAAVEAVAKSIGELATSVKAIQESMAGLKTELQGVSKAQAQTQKDLEAAVKKSDALEKTLKGTVIGGNPEGDDKQTSKKEESSLGNIDTAYQRNVRKSFGHRNHKQ